MFFTPVVIGQFAQNTRRCDLATIDTKNTHILIGYHPQHYEYAFNSIGDVVGPPMKLPAVGLVRRTNHETSCDWPDIKPTRVVIGHTI